MTIRPCPTCGGQAGHYVDVPTGDNWEPCPSCADMPWLTCLDDMIDQHGRRVCMGPAACGGSGRFKPDPETVTKWCEVKGSVIRWGEVCDYHRIEADQINMSANPCPVSWVTRPERLEVAE